MTLKLAVKSTKILRDSIGNNSYPAIFMMTAGLIEYFGQVVFERLFNIAFGDYPPDDNILPSQISEATKDTTRNWFLKISCIRELHSRVFIELALLRCYKFLQIDLSKDLKRLIKQIRGMASPVLSTYACLFALKIGLNLGVASLDLFRLALGDVCGTLVQANDQTLKMCMPALEWIFYYTFKGSNKEETMDTVRALIPSIEANAYLLQALISEMPSSFLLEEIDGFMELINKITVLQKKLNVCISLIVTLSKASRSSDNVEAIKKLWSVTNELAQADFITYIDGVSRIIEVVIMFLDAPAINKMLEDMVNHINNQAIGASVHQHAEQIIKILLHKSQSFETFLAMESFLPLLDLIPSNKKAELCHKIIERFSSEAMKLSISNPLMIHSLFTIARTVNDSLDME